MKTDISTLQDLFKISYETFESSRIEEKEVSNMYHNRQYTEEQLAIFEKRGQPSETFNIVKLFARLLVGYYSTVVNTVKVQPRQENDALTALLLNDVVQYTFENNNFETEGDKVKLDGMLSGLMCVYEDVIKTGKKDSYGRDIHRIQLSHVPSREILLDPISRKEDYSDARFIHRFKWVDADYLEKILRENNSASKSKEIFDRLVAYENHVNQSDTDFDLFYDNKFTGLYTQYDNYLLIHTIIADEKGKVWSVFWCGDEEVSRKEVTYREVRFPYRVQRIHTSDKAEYYGLFREVIEAQKAINQALTRIQLMATSQKAFVQRGAVEDLDSFTDSFNRVNAVVPVIKLDGIKVENLSSTVLEQYALIDKAFNRVQKVLGINDSFLGMAYASDSGRKVKLQQNATILSLRYVTTKVEQLYRLLGWDIVNLVKQFYTAHEVIRIANQATGEHWIEINKPMEIWSGRFDGEGKPVMDVPFEEVTDPESNEPMIDEEGNYVVAPIPDTETEIAFSDVDLSIDTTAYNDEDETNRLMIEAVLNGNVGVALQQYNPGGYLEVAALGISTIRTRHSQNIAEVLRQTAEMLKNQPPPPPEEDIKQTNQQPKITPEESPNGG